MRNRLLIPLVAFGLSGCVLPPDFSGLPALQSAKGVDVIRIDHHLVLRLDARTSALPGEARAELLGVIGRLGHPGNAHIILRGPQGGERLERAARSLAAAGVDRERIAIEPEQPMQRPAGDPDKIDAVIVEYTLVAPACPDWSRADALGDQNTVASDLGCATATNFARMVADPADIAEGRGASGTEATAAAAAVLALGAGKTPALPSDNQTQPFSPIEGSR